MERDGVMVDLNDVCAVDAAPSPAAGAMAAALTDGREAQRASNGPAGISQARPVGH